MEKATFLKVFLVSVLLMLFGQGSHVQGECTSDADCAKIMKCIEAEPICDLTSHQCVCSRNPPTNYGTRNIYKTHQN
ncbi:hypothetical protein EJD97_016809 [Solanum chilense]|uniref:Uncharacterized protein n=1 Tax=Solanum chilense TaxID=4083 RepID=A0A6N2B6Z4_SOLCI|nr:hypothetical protein EJD97_016809 [Solanum chilense]